MQQMGVENEHAFKFLAASSRAILIDFICQNILNFVLSLD